MEANETSAKEALDVLVAMAGESAARADKYAQMPKPLAAEMVKECRDVLAKALKDRDRCVQEASAVLEKLEALKCDACHEPFGDDTVMALVCPKCLARGERDDGVRSDLIRDLAKAVAKAKPSLAKPSLEIDNREFLKRHRR